MASLDDTPARDKNGFVCPRCGFATQQDWVALYTQEWDDNEQDWYDEARDSKRWGSSSVDFARVAVALLPNSAEPDPAAILGTPSPGLWAMARCGKCGESSVWRDKQMVFPRASLAPAPAADMPEDVKVLYIEAGEVWAVSPRAGAAMARATLEKLLKALDPEAGARLDLKPRIDRMIPKVSTPIGEMLTFIRHTGNGSVHVDDEPDDAIVLILDPADEAIVDLMFTTINDLVDELITKPTMTRAAFDKVPKSVRDAVKKKQTEGE
jgi:hypothetical protein